MKTLFTMVVLLLSFKAVAHTCHISLYDPYNRPYLNFYSNMDNNCQAAAQSCYQAISQHRLDPYYYKCYTISITNDPVTTPVRHQVRNQNNQNQNARGSTISDNDQDYRRVLEIGESVFYKDTYGVITFIDEDGRYEFLPEGKKKKEIVKGIDRKEIAISRGCLRNICTKSATISRTHEKHMSVEGIDYLGRYVLQDIVSKKYFFEVEYQNLVRTKGCIETVWGKICTGETAMGPGNRYYIVAGLQSENMLVLKDEEGRLHFNINPGTVVITR
jgi:hypothetical protein